MNQINTSKANPKNPDKEGEEEIKKVEGNFDSEEEIEEENEPEKIRENNYPPEEQR